MPDRLQRLIAALCLVPAVPVMIALALAARLESPGPLLYRATRMGRDGRLFACLKLRTMRWSPARPGLPLTSEGDERVTRVGRVLRRHRLDELPQLWNVVRGEMRLVGPRPEDPRYRDPSDPLHRLVFDAVPGITGLTQLAFADESRLLGPHDPGDRYRTTILPAKLRIDARYLANRSARLDARILAATIAVVFGWRPDPGLVDRWAPRPAAVAGLAEQDMPPGDGC